MIGKALFACIGGYIVGRAVATRYPEETREVLRVLKPAIPVLASETLKGLPSGTEKDVIAAIAEAATGLHQNTLKGGDA